MDRETISTVICQKLATTNSQLYMTMRFDLLGEVLADAILAAIGTPDATGDLLRKMAVSSDGARTTIEIFGLTNDGRFGAKVHRWGTRAVYAYSNTPLAALQAALATVEEAGS